MSMFWKKGSLYLYWRQWAMSILEAGSPCPCFKKKAVFIYTGGRQQCPFWRQAVHVHVLKKRQSLSKAGSHVHSGGRQSMSMFLKKGSLSIILEAGSHVHSGGRQYMASGFRQFMSTFWRLDSLYLYWRQAAVSILEAGSLCPCFEKKAVFIYTGGRKPCSF
jgi:hypothetical protein